VDIHRLEVIISNWFAEKYIEWTWLLECGSDCRRASRFLTQFIIYCACTGCGSLDPDYTPRFILTMLELFSPKIIGVDVVFYVHNTESILYIEDFGDAMSNFSHNSVYPAPGMLILWQWRIHWYKRAGLFGRSDLSLALRNDYSGYGTFHGQGTGNKLYLSGDSQALMHGHVVRTPSPNSPYVPFGIAKGDGEYSRYYWDGLDEYFVDTDPNLVGDSFENSLPGQTPEVFLPVYIDFDALSLLLFKEIHATATLIEVDYPFELVQARNMLAVYIKTHVKLVSGVQIKNVGRTVTVWSDYHSWLSADNFPQNTRDFLLKLIQQTDNPRVRLGLLTSLSDCDIYVNSTAVVSDYFDMGSLVSAVSSFGPICSPGHAVYDIGHVLMTNGDWSEVYGDGSEYLPHAFRLIYFAESVEDIAKFEGFFNKHYQSIFATGRPYTHQSVVVDFWISYYLYSEIGSASIVCDDDVKLVHDFSFPRERQYRYDKLYENLFQ